jgi:hypothetical protein
LTLQSFYISGASDEIDEHSEKRQEENEDEPQSFSPAAVVFASEVVEERPNKS